MTIRYTLFCAIVVLLSAVPKARATSQDWFYISGYTLPVLDVSADMSRRVTVDRELGQYLGHPTTALLPDGKTIFVVYPKGHARGELVLKKSSDGGLTWSDRLPVPENWATSENPPSINLLEDRQGKQRLVILTGSRENRLQDLPVRQALSEDAGKSWTPLRPIGEGVEYNAIVVASSMLRLGDGRYLALQHSDYTNGPDGRRNMKLYKMLSNDGGLTWSKRELVAADSVAEFCEPGGFWSPNHDEIAVLIRDNSRFARNYFRSYVIFSRDQGETWSAPEEASPVLAGDKHVAKYAPDGRLVVVFRDIDVDSPTRGHFIAWVGTYDDLKNKRPGQYRVKLAHNYDAWDCGYAGLELLPDGTFVATTYLQDVPFVRGSTNGPKHAVISIRFTLQEFDQAIAAHR